MKVEADTGANNSAPTAARKLSTPTSSNSKSTPRPTIRSFGLRRSAGPKSSRLRCAVCGVPICWCTIGVGSRTDMSGWAEFEGRGEMWH